MTVSAAGFTALLHRKQWRAYPVTMVEAEPLLLDLVLRPHRSLTPRGFRALMAVLIAFGIVSGVMFLLLGAWPVLGFLGLDVLLVYLAFRASYAGGRVYERIRLSPEALIVDRVDRWGRQRRFEMPPQWLRVEVDAATSRLHLVSHGRSLAIADFLPRDELDEVADAVRQGLAQLRDPRPTN
ncbi:MAG TPA: DUF2244 domain-containing protein [Alphaproteobacteria bacterium]|nr:DUF2244 domain-containing protein [Alphaproteobacteria bacterium]